MIKKVRTNCAQRWLECMKYAWGDCISDWNIKVQINNVIWIISYVGKELYYLMIEYDFNVPIQGYKKRTKNNK